MRYPSVKTLSRVTNATPERAKLARRILTSNREQLEALPIYTDIYYPRIGMYMFNPHKLSELKMELLNIALDGYGVEGVHIGGEIDQWIEYINFGDTYDMTICRFDGQYLVCPWGNIAEKYMDDLD